MIIIDMHLLYLPDIYISGVTKKVNRFLTNIFALIDEPNSLKIYME